MAQGSGRRIGVIAILAALTLGAVPGPGSAAHPGAGARQSAAPSPSAAPDPSGTAHPSPAATPQPIVRTAPLPLPDTLRPGGPAIPLAELPPDVALAFTGAALIDRGGGCSGVLVAPGTGPIPAAAPAYVFTNGHCIDLLPPSVVRRDLGRGGRVDFGWPGGPIARTVAIAGVPWASMKGTDLAIVELDATLVDLAADGIRAVPLADRPAAPGERIAIVGGPVPIDGHARQLLLTTCVQGTSHDLVEETWWWPGFPSNRCADVRPGSSGSPVLEVATGAIVGLVNTGTAGSEGRSDCMRDRPCEVPPNGEPRSVDGAVYGPAIMGLEACFDAGWAFTGPGPDCPLDPGDGLEVTDATEVTNPDRPHPSGREPRTTWGARLSPTDPAITHHVLKTGRLGIIDCLDPEGYGAPVALADAPVHDAPLPTAEGRYQLCLLAGPGPVVDTRWQEPRFATVVTAWVDRTPPLPPVELDIRERPDGWQVEPVAVPPELVTFAWKWGPAATTACADPDGWSVYRHHPRLLPRSEAPLRLCVIGHDPANNPSPTLERVLR